MAAKKSSRGVLETLPLFIVILIPLGVIAFAIWGTNSSVPATSASTNSPAPAQTAPTPPASGTITLDDPASLPTSVPASQFIPFSFTVQNTGGSTEQLQYKVSVLWSTGENDVIDENIASLQPGASTMVNEELKFEIATETAEVTLSLPQVGQNSQFELPRQ